MSTDLRELFLWLVRQGIGAETDTDSWLTVHGSDSIDWVAVKELAERQGLGAVVLDGLEKFRVESSEFRASGKCGGIELPEKLFLTQWIGEVLQGYECRYEQWLRSIAEMARFYNSHGFKMMVVKGYACAMDWPKPEHRPSGDIDIWLFGQQRDADAVLGSWFNAQGLKTEIDNSHHHHTVFYWRDFMVENHYDFINVHHHRSNAAFERILKGLGEDDSHSVELYGERVYLPSPDLHALFLLKHMMLHFASGEISLRQVLDWGFFVKAHGNEVDWKYVTGVLEEFGMMEMFGIFNAICEEELGFVFNDNVNDNLNVDEALKERVLSEILSPEFVGETPSALIPRIVFKYRRWKANGWKHRLCYKESVWSAFWSGVWNHLLKPGSI